jgi:hypothetical protein
VEEQAQAIQVPSMAPPRALTGEAYVDYRAAFVSDSVEGELGAVTTIEALLVRGETAGLAERLRNAVAATELERAAGRIRFLTTWLDAVTAQLPDPAKITRRSEANQAFSALVKSRLPLLMVKEGELLRIGSSLEALAALAGPAAARAEELSGALRRFSEAFGDFSKTLLDKRARG